MNIEDKEQISSIIDHRIADKVKHQEPSAKTLKLFSIMETELRYIKEKISQVPTLAEMNLANEKLVERIMDNCEKKFASKLTERIVFAIAGAAGLWGIYKLLDVLAH